MMSLQSFLIAFMSGSLALGPAVFLLFERVDTYGRVSPLARRFLVAVVCARAGTGAWALAVYLGYQPGPATRQGMAEAIWQYGVLTGMAAFTSSTLIHGAYKLSGQLYGPATMSFAKWLETNDDPELLHTIACVGCPGSDCTKCPAKCQETGIPKSECLHCGEV